VELRFGRVFRADLLEDLLDVRRQGGARGNATDQHLASFVSGRMDEGADDDRTDRDLYQ
jgi:hypothetical protein